MSDAFHIFSMNEVVTSLSYNIYRSQIHVISNPKKEKKNTAYNSKRKRIQQLSNDSESEIC